jgi:outer membrane protein TolC
LELAQAAEAGRDRSESDLYPRIYLEGVIKDGPPGAPNFRLPGLANAGLAQSAGGGLIVTQTFDFGRSSQRLLANTYLSQAATDESEVQRARLSLNVLRAYAQVLLVKDQLALARAALEARHEIARQADARFRGGLVSRVDLGLAQADLAEASVEVLELESQWHSAWAGLYAAMGQGADGPELALESLSGDVEAWNTSWDEDIAVALAQRPEVKMSLAQVEAARAQFGGAQANYHPYLSLYAAGGYIANLNGPPSSPNTYGLGMALSVPVFTAGANEAEVRQEEHKLAAAQAGQQEVAQGVQLEVQQARLRFASQRQRRSALEEEARAAQDGSKLARTRYRLGLGSILEVQQTELVRVRADSRLLRNRTEIWLAWVELLYVTGQLVPNFQEVTPP